MEKDCNTTPGTTTVCPVKTGHRAFGDLMLDVLPDQDEEQAQET